MTASLAKQQAAYQNIQLINTPPATLFPWS